jgi:4-amino-4-deoxy-L-arabinose transferase-like glycosyltransferase
VRLDRQVVAQAALVVISWLFLCGLHASNDGLWCVGDASRHFANGLFWRDYLRSLDPHPVDFATAYYARYPAINPVSYPPVFYLLEAAALSLVGPSPFVAKALVLGFTLVAALYTMAWLRRSVAPEAGYLGALLPLLPEVALLSHAVMLNVPALALVVAALYHARRWLEAPDSWQLYPAALLSVLAILCYIPSAILVLVLLAWIAMLGRGRLLLDPRTLVVAAVAGLALLPWALIVIRWAPAHAQMTTPTTATILRLKSWAFYAGCWRDCFGLGPSTLAAAGAIAGLAHRRWRRETALLLAWVGVTYVALTYLRAKDARYLLPLAAPLVCLGAIPILAPVRGVGIPWARGDGSEIALAGMLVLVVAQGWSAWLTPVPDVRGFRELVAFLDRVAPGEPVFYDGLYSGIFIAQCRAGDDEVRRRVVRGDQLLYVAPLNRAMKARDFVASRRDVVEALRTRSGCRWLAIAEGGVPSPRPAAALLREAVAGSEFERVRSFPISGTRIARVDVYRMRIPVEAPQVVDLPVPMLGPDARLRGRPIAPGRIGPVPGS